MRRTYLDHAATTPTRPDVVQAMLPYRKKVMDQFKDSCNVGEIENLDGVGHVGNPVCGDIVELHIKTEDGMIIREHMESKHRLSV